MRQLLRTSWQSYRDHDGAVLASALSFRVLLALAPLGVVAVGAVDFVLGEERARTELLTGLAARTDASTASFIEETVLRAAGRLEAASDRGLFAWLASLFFFFAAIRLFSTLRRCLNRVFDVRRTASDASMAWPRRAWLAFFVVLVGALLLLAALARVAFAVVSTWFVVVPTLWQVAEVGLFLGLLAVFFYATFRALPDARLHNRDAWVGAAFTAVLVGIGSDLSGHYLVRILPISIYGGAGSLIVILMWLFYSTQAFLFGAEFTAAYAAKQGRPITPRPYAVHIEKSDPSATHR